MERSTPTGSPLRRISLFLNPSSTTFSPAHSPSGHQFLVRKAITETAHCAGPQSDFQKMRTMRDCGARAKCRRDVHRFRQFALGNTGFECRLPVNLDAIGALRGE